MYRHVKAIKDGYIKNLFEFDEPGRQFCTKGKIYEVINIDGFNSFCIIDDTGDSHWFEDFVWFIPVDYELQDEVDRLKVELAHITEERDAAIADIERYTSCQACKNSKCFKRNGRENCKFIWRGIK